MDVSTSALESCNAPTNCNIPGLSGTCVGVDCVAHQCQYVTACAGGCTVGLAAVECQVTGACNAVPCKAADAMHANPWCDFNDYTATTATCQCTTATVATACAPNSCQQNATCQSGTCTYEAKAPIANPCCNVAADCGGTASCSSNICGCTGGSKFCGGAAAGDGRCVPTAGCCAPTDCAAGNTCQARTCSVAGACGFQSNGTPGCCDNAATDCGGTATCAANRCTCGAGEKFCVGSGAGNGSCIPSSGCCVDADCPAHTNATATCDNAHACVYACNSGFHNCSGTCASDNAVTSCGALCTSCPAGNSCQTPACDGANCGFVAAGASPCCNMPSDCTPSNACQAATECTANRCVFGSTGSAGCCNSASDCPTPADACLEATCVANQCAESPIAGCTDGGAGGDDMDVDMNVETPDQSAAVSLAGGGGCALAGAHDSPRALALVTLFGLVLAVAFVRRRHA